MTAPGVWSRKFTVTGAPQGVAWTISKGGVTGGEFTVMVFVSICGQVPYTFDKLTVCVPANVNSQLSGFAVPTLTPSTSQFRCAGDGLLTSVKLAVAAAQTLTGKVKFV